MSRNVIYSHNRKISRNRIKNKVGAIVTVAVVALSIGSSLAVSPLSSLFQPTFAKGGAGGGGGGTVAAPGGGGGGGGGKQTAPAPVFAPVILDQVVTPYGAVANVSPQGLYDYLLDKEPTIAANLIQIQLVPETDVHVIGRIDQAEGLKVCDAVSRYIYSQPDTETVNIIIHGDGHAPIWAYRIGAAGNCVT